MIAGDGVLNFFRCVSIYLHADCCCLFSRFVHIGGGVTGRAGPSAKSNEKRIMMKATGRLNSDSFSKD
jgi:hypothetical protein